VPEPWVITGGALGSGTNVATRFCFVVDKFADRDAIEDWAITPSTETVVRAQQTIFRAEFIISVA
jgi:hypothetical protein